MNDRIVEIKCEVFFEVFFDEKLTRKEIINRIRKCETLFDLTDNNINFNQLNDNYDIASKNSIYITEFDTTNSNLYILNLE